MSERKLQAITSSNLSALVLEHGLPTANPRAIHSNNHIIGSVRFIGIRGKSEQVIVLNASILRASATTEAYYTRITELFVGE